MNNLHVTQDFNTAFRLKLHISLSLSIHLSFSPTHSLSLSLSPQKSLPRTTGRLIHQNLEFSSSQRIGEHQLFLFNSTWAWFNIVWPLDGRMAPGRAATTGSDLSTRTTTTKKKMATSPASHVTLPPTPETAFLGFPDSSFSSAFHLLRNALAEPVLRHRFTPGR